MAWGFVAKASNDAFGGPTSVSVSYTPTAGNLLVVSASDNSGKAATFTISDGHNTYTLADSFTGTNGTKPTLYVWFAPNVAGTALTITATGNTSSADDMEIAVLEFSGGGASPSLDGHNHNSGTTTGTVSGTSGSFTVANVNDLVIGVFAEETAGGGGFTAGVNGSGFTKENQRDGLLCDEWQVWTSSGSINADCTATGVVNGWCMVGFALALSATGGLTDPCGM